MKLQAIISGSQTTSKSGGKARGIATVDGRYYELDLKPGSDQDYLMLDDGSLRLPRDGRLESGRQVDVMVGAIVSDHPHRSEAVRSASGAVAHGEGAARIVAPMPGKLVRLLVEAGQEVEAGQYPGCRSDEDAERNEVPEERDDRFD
jgi:hypothetical protein